MSQNTSRIGSLSNFKSPDIVRPHIKARHLPYNRIESTGNMTPNVLKNQIKAYVWSNFIPIKLYIIFQAIPTSYDPILASGNKSTPLRDKVFNFPFNLGTFLIIFVWLFKKKNSRKTWQDFSKYDKNISQREKKKVEKGNLKGTKGPMVTGTMHSGEHGNPRSLDFRKNPFLIIFSTFRPFCL